MGRLNNKFYCSTGAFTGRINGRDHRLVLLHGDKLHCDGFELMIYSNWYERLASVIADLRAGGMAFPVVHADKATGDLLSTADKKEIQRSLELFKVNCSVAAELSSEKIVVHIWGIPDSDKEIDSIFDSYQQMVQIGRSFGIDVLAENTACINGTPLGNFMKFTDRYEGCGFTIDTRPAAFHGELEDICGCSTLWKNNLVRHIHINDYAGGLKEWKALRPILQPGKGNIDFARFFSCLKAVGYKGSITLEAPSMLPEGIDTETLNRSLDFIRRGLEEG